MTTITRNISPDENITWHKYRTRPEGDKFPENAELTLKLLKRQIETGNYDTTEKVLDLINHLLGDVDDAVPGKPFIGDRHDSNGSR